MLQRHFLLATLGLSLILTLPIIPAIGAPIHPLVLEFTATTAADTAWASHFPWQEYDQSHPLHQYGQLEADRQYLDSLGYDSEVFLEGVFMTYIEAHAPALTEEARVQEYIQLGERYLRINTVVPEAHYMYAAMGSYQLEVLCKQINNAIATGTLSGKSDWVKFLSRRLEESQYLVKVPVKDYEKFLHHLGEGNFHYLWIRIRYRYWTEFLLLVGGSLAGLVLLFRGKRIYFYLKKTKKP